MQSSPADDAASLRSQLTVERGLREAADAENERLTAQIATYAEDLGQLYQERHGRGRGGLAAENATLRANLTDEAARGQAFGALYQRSAEQARGLTEQLVTYGRDIARTYRKAKRGPGTVPWWQRLLPVSLLTGVLGLLGGAVAIGVVTPPIPFAFASAAAVTTPSTSLSPPIAAPSALATAFFISNGVVGNATPGANAAAYAASAAGLFYSDTATSTPVASLSASRDTPLPRLTRDVLSPRPAAVTTAAPPPTSTPAAPPTIAPELIATVTSLAATVEALEVAGTALAQTATAAARATTPTRAATQTPTPTPTSTPTQTPTPTPTTSVRSLNPVGYLKRCMFEVLVPPLDAGATYAVRFEQRHRADIVALWSHRVGTVLLAEEAGAIVGITSPTGANEDVVAAAQPAGVYRVELRSEGSPVGETRLALFYDDQSLCKPEPEGILRPVRLTVPTPTSTPAPSDATPLAATLVHAASLADGSTPFPRVAGPVPNVQGPTPTAADAPPAATPRSTSTIETLEPTAAIAMPRPRPQIDCRPYLRGPTGFMQIDPIVWLDDARTVRGSSTLHVVLVGPRGTTVDDVFIEPYGTTRQYPLPANGAYILRMTAPEGADADSNCTWFFDYTRY